MNDKQIWQQSKEEFNERAFERFVIKTGTKEGDIYPCSNETVEIELRLGIRDLQLKPLPELFAHDVEVYGENAYLMWEWIFDNEKDNDWKPFKNNQDVIDALNSVNYTVRRKISAALPFDLERAKKKDVVQVFQNDSFIDFDFKRWLLSGDVGIDDISFQYPADLRMKYPQKLER